MKKQLLTGLAILVTIAVNAQFSLLKDINQGTGDSNPNDAYVYNGKVYFAADSGAGETTGGVDVGNELWVSDGTLAGTMLLKDVYDGASSSGPEGFFEYNGSLYFTGSASGGSQLYKLNATGDDVEAVGVQGFRSFCELNGNIYFVNDLPNTGNLMVFDGTTVNPVTNNGSNGTETISVNVSNISRTVLTVYNNKIYFTGTLSADTDVVGYELYTYDPSTGLFELVKDIMPGLNTAGTGPAGGNISNFYVANNKLYFKAETNGYLYESDGTTDGTIPVAVATTEGIQGVLSLYLWNDKIYFEGDNGTGDQLWVYDPVADTVTKISNEASSTHDPRYYAGVGSDLFYVGRNASDSDWHLYRVKNGTDWEYISTTDYLDCEWLFEMGGKLYFEGDDDGAGANFLYGTELYVLDPATLSVSNKKLVGITGLYPNPAIDNITVDKSLINANYGIYDITGKIVKQGIVESQKINLNLNTGLYIFKAQTDLGYFAQKLIIK